MSTMTLVHTNGSKPHVESEAWLRQTARSFFSSINWDDNPPEVQELKLTTVVQADGSAPLSLLLTVNQFITAVNWDGIAIAATPIIADAVPTDIGTMNDFTLEDFSDLF